MFSMFEFFKILGLYCFWKQIIFQAVQELHIIFVFPSTLSYHLANLKTNFSGEFPSYFPVYLCRFSQTYPGYVPKTGTDRKKF